MCVCFVLLMVLRPLRSTPTDTRFSYTTLFRSAGRGVLWRRWGSAPGKLWWRGAAVWRSEGPRCGVAGPWRDAPEVLLCYYCASVLAGGDGLGLGDAAGPRCGGAVPPGEGGGRGWWGCWHCWRWSLGGGGGRDR